MVQTIYRGSGCLQGLTELLAGNKCARVLVVRGRSSFDSTGAQKILDLSPGIEFIHFGDVTANPETETVLRCATLFRETKPDTVLAIGGGSVMDTAKAVLAYSTGNPEAEILANRFDPTPGRPHFWAVPTTAGSGSESTHFAVLYKDGVKFSLAHPGLKPEKIFLDPLVTQSCPPMLTLSSGVDAVCQAVESYWSRGANPVSRKLALESLPLLLSNIFSAVQNPTNLAFREAMLIGANLAGQAIDISKTTAGHALSYGLTSTFGLPHGIAVLLALGPLVELMDTKYGFFAKRTELDTAFALFGQSFPEAFNKFYGAFAHALDKKIRFSTTDADTGPTVAKLCSGVNVERLSNHPVTLSEDDISHLYQTIMGRLTRSISVAICTYNGAKYIEAQIDSILNQTQPPQEIIVCDDGSSDDTVEIVRRIAKRTTVKILVMENRDNLGVTKNFEKAILACSGNTIFLADQDDVWMPEKIAKMSTPLIEDPEVGLVYSDAIITDANLQPSDMTVFGTRGKSQIWLGSNRDIREVLKRPNVKGCTLAISSDYLAHIFPIPVKDGKTIWTHDYWIYFILYSISKIVVLDEPLMYYRIHADNASGLVEKNKNAINRKKKKYRVQYTASNVPVKIALYDTLFKRLRIILNTPGVLKNRNFIASILNVIDIERKTLVERNSIWNETRFFSRSGKAVGFLFRGKYLAFKKWPIQFLKDILGLNNT